MMYKLILQILVFVLLVGCRGSGPETARGEGEPQVIPTDTIEVPSMNDFSNRVPVGPGECQWYHVAGYDVWFEACMEVSEFMPEDAEIVGVTPQATTFCRDNPYCIFVPWVEKDLVSSPITVKLFCRYRVQAFFNFVTVAHFRNNARVTMPERNRTNPLAVNAPAFWRNYDMAGTQTALVPGVTWSGMSQMSFPPIGQTFDQVGNVVAQANLALQLPQVGSFTNVFASILEVTATRSPVCY